MQNYAYKTSGVCAQKISFGLEDGKIYNLQFLGGCNGNLKAISKLLEGQDADHAADILMGNDCGGRGTSCADQLARAIKDAMAQTEEPTA